jgi:hypothetical protein
MLLLPPIVTITITIVMIIVTIGGLVLFLKSEKPTLKWGGLFAFGVGLFFFLLGYPLFGLMPPP